MFFSMKKSDVGRCGEPGPVPGRTRKCQRRLDAERTGALVWSALLGAYILPDAPRRQVSWRVRYYARPDAVLHDGEPFRWTCCPFCGGDLVPPASTLVFGQGDGDEG